MARRLVRPRRRRSRRTHPDTWHARTGIWFCATATGLILTVLMPTVLGVLLLAGVGIDMRRCLAHRPDPDADPRAERRRQ
ncbi:hypothetical protein ABN034_12495 [Actinopolymorpha sp. B11F2]|uniref:hypothetical protein n=1 Tax=Actinopolymorpha sp. B11F2 TaxID=3160862 RepID=UPI0032E44696